MKDLQLKKFLGLNDDYSNSSSSSSSDCEQNISEVSSEISATQSKTESEQIIPPSPKRINRSPWALCRAVFLFLCILNIVVIFSYIFINV